MHDAGPDHNEPDLDDLRAELGLDDGLVAINAGSWGPLCRAAQQAIADAYARDRARRPSDHRGYMEEFYDQVADRDREEVARLVNCAPRDLTLCESSTAAMNIFLWGCDLQPDDEILTGSLENPAATVPLRILARRRGLQLTTVDLGAGDVDAGAAFAAHITGRTRAILVSDVNFATGARVDLAAICEIAHRHGILVLGDGIQAAGVCPTDVRAMGVDAYALARHKFLCGPDGAGVLYVSPQALDRIQPTYAGVFADAGHGRGAEVDLFPDARRFEVSTRAAPVVAGATAAVRWLRETLGWPEIHARIDRHYRALREMLASIDGVEVLSPVARGGALLTFAVGGVEPERVLDRLHAERIHGRTIVVTDPPAVRLAIGPWTRGSDLARIGDVVAEIAAERSVTR